MAFNVSSGITSVTGSVTSTQQKNTVSAISGVGVQGATTTIGTVGAGKVWRVIYAEISVYSNNAGFTSQIKFNDVAMVTASMSGLATQLTTTIGTFNGSYADAIVLTAGQTVKTVLEAGMVDSHYNVYYIEETA